MSTNQPPPGGQWGPPGPIPPGGQTGPMPPTGGQPGPPPGPPPAGPPPGWPAPGGPPPGGPPPGGPPPGQAPGGPPPGWTQPEWIGAGGPPPPPPRRRRGIVLGAIGAAFAILVGGGAFAAYQYLSGGGPQPAEALPNNTLAYLRIDLDPSASQKVNASQLLRRIPEFESSTGISSDTEDLRELMFDTMVPASECDLSYDDDVKPWIGDRAGLAAVPVDDRLVAVAAIQVSDEQAAKDAVSAIEECGMGAPMFGGGIAGQAEAAAADPVMASAATSGSASADEKVAFVGDYMLIADYPDALADIVDAAESSPLSGSEQYQSDMDALDGEGMASYWIDVDGLRAKAEEMGKLDELGPGLEDIHTTFGALRAGSDHIELVSQSTSDIDISSDVENPISGLPNTTLAALSVSGGSDLVDEYWPGVQGMVEGLGGPSAYTEMLTSVEEETGLVLPADLNTVLGDNITLSMDTTGFTAENLEAENPSKFYFGARLTTDKAAIDDVVTRVNERLAAEGMPGLITQEADGGLVVASNEDYAGMLVSGGDLGSQDGFETAVPDASESSAAFYLDFDRLSSVMAEAQAGDEELANVEPLRGLGASLSQVDDGQRFTVRLVFD